MTRFLGKQNGNDAYLFMYFEVVLKKKIHVKLKKTILLKITNQGSFCYAKRDTKKN